LVHQNYPSGHRFYYYIKSAIITASFYDQSNSRFLENEEIVSDLNKNRNINAPSGIQIEEIRVLIKKLFHLLSLRFD